MKTYIGTKQVKAEPMDELAAVEKGYARKNEDNHEWRQGYHVQYANPDGSTYDSWSPKDVFERSYNVCDEEQIAMVCFPLTNRSINKAVSLLTIGGADDKILEEVAAKMEDLKKKGFAIVPSKIYNTGDEGQQFEMMVPLLALGISLQVCANPNAGLTCSTNSVGEVSDATPSSVASTSPIWSLLRSTHKYHGSAVSSTSMFNSSSHEQQYNPCL